MRLLATRVKTLILNSECEMTARRLFLRQISQELVEKMGFPQIKSAGVSCVQIGDCDLTSRDFSFLLRVTLVKPAYR